MRDSDVQREINNMTVNRTNSMNRESVRSSGKGSIPRPFSVAQEQYDARWDMIFGRDKGDKERNVDFDREMDKKEETKDE